MKSLAQNVGRRVFCELKIFTLTMNSQENIMSIGVLVAILKIPDISYRVIWNMAKSVIYKGVFNERTGQGILRIEEVRYY